MRKDCGCHPNQPYKANLSVQLVNLAYLHNVSNFHRPGAVKMGLCL